MAIVRRLVAQDDNDDNEWLKVDHDSRYIVNDMDDWQFLFGPNSALSNSRQIVKIAARFDDQSFSKIKFAAYLFDQKNGSISNGATCVFNIYRVETSTWNDEFITAINGVIQSNNYFYAESLTSALSDFDFSGGDTMMIEATVIRLGVPYRDRIYVNHLGIFDSLIRLKNKVTFLDVTKLDE